MANDNQRVRFSPAEKAALSTGQEITDGEIIWRKRADGSGVWRYDFRLNGRRYKGVLGREKDNVTLSQARAEYARIRAQATLDAPIRPSTTTGARLCERRFEDAAESFLAWSKAHHSDYRHNQDRMEKHLLPRFRGRTLGAISAGDVEALRTDLLNTGLARSTVKRIVSLLSNVFEHARQSDPNVPNPTRGLRKLRPEPKEIQVFTDPQVSRLLDPAINPEVRDRAMVALACYAGLRASEVLGLQWRHVDLNGGRLHIRQTALEGDIRETTKSGKDRFVPISKSLRPTLQELQAQADADSPWLFPGRSGDKPMHQVQYVFRRMKARAGLADAPGFHALRHTFATRALERQVTVHVLQKWLGHSSLQMTEQYVHFTGQHAEQMAALLP